MCVLQCFEHPDEELGPALEGVLRVVLRVTGREPTDDGFQILALDVLHDEVVPPVFVEPDVMDRDDVGVLELTDRSDFVDEPRD